MSEKPKVVGPTEIPTSNPFGDVEIRASIGRRRANRTGTDLLAVLRERVRAAVNRTRASRLLA